MADLIILAVALVILIVAVYRPLTRAVFGALDARAERIKHELEEAQRLREEAQSMLANYQRKLHEGETQAKAIIDHAEEESQRLERLAREQLEQRMQRRTQQAMDRIAAAEGRALQDDGDRARAVMDDALDEVRRQLA
ncbi:MAG: F0F1 ATP synthase subunit B [Alphaproteobacteria bacterium]